jgi:hypothetical protein
MKFNDNRSFKVLIVPDCVVNWSAYPEIPGLENLYRKIEENGYGIIKMPPLKYSDSKVSPWIVSAVDQIQEYTNRGFRVAVVCLSFLENKGVWFNELRNEIKGRGLDFSNFIIITKKDLVSNRGYEKIGKF